MPKIYFVGVDVGTSSVRAALVSSNGKVLKKAVQNIKVWNPEPDYFEQSSQDIWEAVCYCVKSVSTKIPKEEIIAISFDATCSLVVLGNNGSPITVNTCGRAQQNVILWMDHRAQKQANQINDTNHELLKYVGGQVSLEMQLPKLLWLRQNHYLTTWKRIWRVFDLPDFLTWRATNDESRSLCTVTCKWNYDPVNMEWNKEFFETLGIDDLLKNGAEIIGREIKEPGSPVGQGLSEKAAKELNLVQGTVVGHSLIDAHAGALGLFGVQSTENVIQLENKLALICGTSTCHMSLTKEPCEANGIWGPYPGAIIPGYYLNEAGQSAAGLLLDYIVKTHPKYMHIKEKLRANESIYPYLNKMVKEMAQARNLSDPCYLTKNVHAYPDFHGNRSPLSDPKLRGMICGLNMNEDEESLAILYLAFVQALAYSTRHIIENLVEHGRDVFHGLLFCGGLAKNDLYVKCHADICQIPALIPDEKEMVLLGAAMLGACAAKVYNTLEAASQAMGGTGKKLEPETTIKDYHDRKYKVFLKMLDDQYKYNDIMS